MPSQNTNKRASVLPENALAPHSSTLAWKIPWMEEPGGLQSMGSLEMVSSPIPTECEKYSVVQEEGKNFF